MCAIVEKDIVADFRAQADRSGKGFDTAARVQGEIGCPNAQAYLVDEAGGRTLARHIEVLKSNLTGQKKAERTSARLKLRTEEPVQDTQVAPNVGNGYAVCESTGVIPPEVVAHFRFEL